MDTDSSQKIKFTIGILAISAVLSIYSLFGSIKIPTGNQTAAVANTLTNPSNDDDHDGLTNEEESYWETDFQNSDTDGDGFKDGEEVASNHDPIIVGPNDLLFDDSPQNVTKKISNLVLGGIVEGSLQPDSSNYIQSIEQLVDEILSQSTINLTDIPKIQLNVVDQNENSLRIYSDTVSPILKTIATEDPTGTKKLLEAFLSAGSVSDMSHPALSHFFNSEILKLQGQANQLQSMPVPKAWVDGHSQIIYFLKVSIKNYQSIQSVNEDPFQAITGLANIMRFMLDDLPKILKTFAPIYKE